MMPYHGRSARSSYSTRVSRNGMEFYLKSLEEPSPSSTWARWAACRVERKEAKDKNSEFGSHSDQEGIERRLTMDKGRLECIMSGLNRYELTGLEKRFVQSGEQYFKEKIMLTDQQESILEGVYWEKTG